MSDSKINPMYHVYASFSELVENIEIKYDYMVEKYETTEMQRYADTYMDAVLEKDTFDMYEYSYEELIAVGIHDVDILRGAVGGDNSIIPIKYHDKLLTNKRLYIISTYEEPNNYYRMYHGLPDVEDEKKFYPTDGMCDLYNIDKSIPIHEIRDYYNSISDKYGDRIISNIEGSGYIDELIKAHPDKKYLKFIGKRRISILRLRQTKNFQILYLDPGTVKHIVYHEFIQLYNQCRDYFVYVCYIREFRTFIDYYDNFIAMCIMVMTIQQLVAKQMQLSTNREFFDIYAVKMLYQNYGIPYNLYLDDDTQSRIAKNLNILIQEKATDKCLYDIAAVLGFGNNFNVFKYYLSKEHKLDSYGVPIFKTRENFNTDTGEVEIIPDYEEMYDLYFHRTELNDEDFTNTFNSTINRSEYNEVTEADPYWWKDSNLYKKIYETEYNYVESKYLSLSVSYRMTDLVLENILLLKMLMQKSVDKNYSHYELSIPRKVSSLRVVEDSISDLEYDRTRMIKYSDVVNDVPTVEVGDFVHWVKQYRNELYGLNITLPKLTGSLEVPIFDAVVALICLTSCTHNLTGEVVTLPSELLSVMDYIQNTESGTSNLANSFAFDFDYFNPNNEAGWKDLEKIKILLTEEEREELMSCLEVLRLDIYSGTEKINKLNEMFLNIKHLKKFLEYMMTHTDNRELYTRLKEFHYAIFYAKEMKDVFTIIGDEYGIERTALNFFEYLFHKNRFLYLSMFEFSYDEAYEDYKTLLNKIENGEGYKRYSAKDTYPTCFEYGKVSIYCEWYDDNGNKRTEEELQAYTLSRFKKNKAEFLSDVENGYIYLHYDVLKDVIVDNVDTKNEKIYFYVNHIISRLETVMYDLNYIALLGDATTPLEQLLFKLCMFFKSYTTEIIDLDTIYICDLIPENMFRLFDEVSFTDKTILEKEHMKLPYSDIIDVIGRIWIKDHKKGEDLSMWEKWIKIIYIWFDRHPWTYSTVAMNDLIAWVDKTIASKDDVNFYDIFKGESINEDLQDDLIKGTKNFKDRIEGNKSVILDDKTLTDDISPLVTMRDKIVKIWYS